jgi:dihydrofolate synthase/folylpolyglutamate synthase
MNFDEALRYLLSLGHETLAIKLGLSNTERLLEALGNPQTSFPSLQIAGTNGKGSTAVMLEAVACAARIRTGLYTSPHLRSITERIRIDNREISREDFARLAMRVKNAAEMLIAEGVLLTLPTFFEQVTAIALLAFREARLQLAILETGLGGRLDATTVALARWVAITPVAIDHQEYLGEKLSQIAAEKAAIIRPGVTAVILAPQEPEALRVIMERCDACGVKPRLGECQVEVTGAVDTGRMRVTFETKRGRYENVTLGLRGQHQITNASVAITLAETLRAGGFPISHEAIVEGLESARHAGRLELQEVASKSILFDGAHNAAGARALREFLDEFVSSPITLVFGAMRDKDLTEIAATLFPIASHLILTGVSNPRAASLETLAELVPQDFDSSRITLAPSVREALRAAEAQTQTNGIILVTGSLYLIGEVQSIIS